MSASFAVGPNCPVSMELMVLRETPTISASWAWERPFSARASFSRFFSTSLLSTSIPPRLFPAQENVDMADGEQRDPGSARQGQRKLPALPQLRPLRPGQNRRTAEHYGVQPPVHPSACGELDKEERSRESRHRDPCGAVALLLHLLPVEIPASVLLPTSRQDLFLFHGSPVLPSFLFITDPDDTK